MQNDQRSAGLVLQSMSVHGSYHSPQLPPGLLPAHTASSLAASPARQRGRNRPSSGSSKKHCNCKNSRCLKLYCECFASGRYCDGCNCVNCCNNMENESTRQSAVEAILERNPNAFRPKIQAGAAEEGVAAGTARHNKGCNCKKSGCLKKYCECFQAGIFCGDNCKCIDCKNFEGSEAREAVALTAFQPQDMPSRHHQPLPHHHSPVQNKRQRLAPSHSMHRQQQHPPLPAIPVNNRHQPLPAIPEMASRGMHHASRSRGHQVHAPPGDVAGPGQNAAHSGHQIGGQIGPIGTALTMGASAPVQRNDGFLQETLDEMFKRGGIEEVCGLLIQVGNEPAGIVSSPSAKSQSQASADDLHGPCPAPEAGQDGAVQGSDPTADSAEQQSGSTGVSRSYEAHERAVLLEYHDILQKLVDRAGQKQKEANQHLQKPQLSRENSAPSSRPSSAPAGFADGSQQPLSGQGSGVNNSSSNPMLQYPQTSSMQQHHQQPPQQLQQQHASGASQPPAGASYLTPSSSSFLAPNHFSGNSDGRNGSIHLPLGVSHVDPDSYLTSPTQSGLVNPIQTGMGSVTNPSLSGLSNAHQLAFANPVQTGMGNSSQAAGLYQRPSSAQPQGPRQNMQLGLNRQGSQVSGLANPLGPNRPAASEASAGLRQTAPPPGMQLPLGSVITNPPIQTMTHHSSQLQSQALGGHFQQHLPSTRAYQIQSFTNALVDASQPLTAPSMHSLPSHASSQGFPQSQGCFSQPLSSQGPGFMTSQGFSQPQHAQGSSMQPHPSQAFFSQPQPSHGFFPHSQGQSMSAHTGQSALLQPQAGQTDRNPLVQGLPNGVAHGEALPDGSAHLPSSLPGHQEP